MQTLSLISKARQFSSDIVSVIPYLGYARQDREFLPGEVVTLSVITKLLKAAGASKVIVVDIHSQMGLKHFDIPVKNVSAVQELVNHFKKLKLKDPLVVSPDLGGATRAEEFATFYGTDFMHSKNTRPKDRQGRDHDFKFGWSERKGFGSS